MTLEDHLQRPTDPFLIDPARQTKSHRHVIRGQIRQRLMQEPHPLLGKRHGQRLIPVGLFDRASVFGMFPQGRHLLCHPRYRGMLKHAAQGHLHVEPAGYLRTDGHSQQGVATQVEEIFANPYSLPAQHRLPDLHQSGLQFISWCHIVCARSQFHSLQFLQYLPVHLAVRSQGQDREQIETRRNHVLRQFLPQPLPQGSDRHCDLLPANHKGRKRFVPATLVLGHDRTGRQIRMPAEHGLDFT